MEPPWRLNIGSIESAAPRNLRSNSRCCGRNGRSRFRSSTKTFARWSHPYTLGVLHLWKMAPVYCQAVVNHDQRIGLDGAPVEAVDAGAKDLAARRLAQLAARKSVKKAAKRTAPAVMTPTPVPAPATETPEQLRARVRASLLRRSA
jgi:ProQ/FINO family